MIREKSNFPDNGKCMVFVHLMNGFVLPCPVDPRQVKTNIKHFLALFWVGALLIVFHQCGLGSIIRLCGIFGMNLCMVSARFTEVFLRYGTPVFPYSEN